MNRMIVISRGGRTTVYSGWRAWLMSATAFVVALAVLALVTFVLLGIAVSIGALLVLLIPVAVVMSLLVWAFGRREG